jgi:hypothetical protein
MSFILISLKRKKKKSIKLNQINQGYDFKKSCYHEYLEKKTLVGKKNNLNFSNFKLVIYYNLFITFFLFKLNVQNKQP